MGIVKMRRHHQFIDRGYPYGTDILYVYCDKCGSFSITTYLGLEKWLLIIGCCVLTAAVMSWRWPSAVYPDRVLVGELCLPFAVCLVVCGFAIKFLWGEENYKCRKCGNVDILINKLQDYASEIPKYNTRNYPSDMAVVDVPDHLTQKRYQGYWDDDYR